MTLYALCNFSTLTPPIQTSHHAWLRPPALASSIQTGIESRVKLVASQSAGCTEKGGRDCTARPFYISYEHKALIREDVDGYREAAAFTYDTRGVSAGER